MFKKIKNLLFLSFVICFTFIASACTITINLYIPAIHIGTEEVSFHFIELGNGKTGDCIYINCGDTDIIVDGGSRTNSSTTIKNYINQFVTDGKIEFGIITHADQDHIASFAGDGSNQSLFEIYEFETIIDFPKTNKDTQVYNRYIEKRNAEVNAGAKRYSALECYNEENGAHKSYELGTNVSLNILYNYFYENQSSDENNYSVCFEIVQNENKFLFTGDLEEDGEEYLVEYNELSKVKLFKAGHHGSKTSSNDCLLDVIQPDICVVCCCAGSVEYTQNLNNTFPTQDFVDRISKWTEKVYVTTVGSIEHNGEKYEDISYESMNGDIVVSSGSIITVNCSNNNTVLKDTDWFKTYRTMPTSWAS